MTVLAHEKQHRVIRIATRKSTLALAQAATVERELRRYAAVACEIVPIVTSGDAHPQRSLAAIGGDGVFVKELMTALVEGRADIAVHSLKDVPTTLAKELNAGAVLKREDARDALVVREELVAGNGGKTTVASLPFGAVVGTSSQRRCAQLRAMRPDLDIRPLRGNVDTRLAKVREGAFDATVLAIAGLKRLGRADARSVTPLGPEIMIPAAGQGAIFAQCRADDAHTIELLAPLNDSATALATQLERAFLAALGGGCLAPVGVHVEILHRTFRLQVFVGTADGARFMHRLSQGSHTDAAEAVRGVEAVASEMLAAGAREIVESSRQANPDMSNAQDTSAS